MELFSTVRELMVEGCITHVDSDGAFRVERSDTLEQTRCTALFTNRRERLDLRIGDEVLVVLNEARSDGYIVGIVRCGGADAPRDASGVPEDVDLSAARSIQLRCGLSTLTLRADGTVVLRGVHVTSRASGVNKVKGAAVRIN